MRTCRRHDPREGRRAGVVAQRFIAPRPGLPRGHGAPPGVRDAHDGAPAGQRRLPERAALPRAATTAASSSTRSSYYLAPTENMICGDTQREHRVAGVGGVARSGRTGTGVCRCPAPARTSGTACATTCRASSIRARGWIATANHDIHPAGLRSAALLQERARSARASIASQQVLSSRSGFTLIGHAGAAARRALRRRARATSRSSAGGRRATPAWSGRGRRSPRGTRSTGARARRPRVYRFASPRDERARRAPRSTDARAPAARCSRRAIAAAIDSLRRTQGSDRGAVALGADQHAASCRIRSCAPTTSRRWSGTAAPASWRRSARRTARSSTWATSTPRWRRTCRASRGSRAARSTRTSWRRYGKGEYFPLAYSRAAVERAAAHRLVLVPAR